MIKRLFDIVVASVSLAVLSPLILLVAAVIKLDSRGPAFFRQERIGSRFRPFLIYKFRTMVQDAPARGAVITIGLDPRVTRVGRYLRKSKIDELPQLINVFKGEMSFVGPRPEVPKFVELFRNDYEEILKVRPGITDLASVKYRDEATVLARSKNPEEEYINHILPDKIKLAKEYIKRSSLSFDLTLVFRTLCKVFLYRTVS